MKRIFTKFQKYARDGGLYPKGYRIAYYDNIAMRFVCYPLGIHWLVRWAHWIWQWTYYWQPSMLDRYVAKCVAVEKYKRERAQEGEPYAPSDLYQEFLGRPLEEREAMLTAARRAMETISDSMQQEVWKSEYSDPPKESP